MSLEYRKNVAFSLAVLFLKLVGFRLSSSRIEEWLNNVSLACTLFSVLFYIWIQLTRLYFLWGDFSVCSSIVSYLVVPSMDLIKLTILLIHKEKFLDLIEFMKKNFFHLHYDQNENTIISDANKECFYFVCIFSFFTESTVFCYVVTAVTENIGKNETDRTLMYDLYLDLPLTKSPYYEFTFAIQVLALYQIGMCYLCFDNMFCIMCLQGACQFRILQHRMANMPILKDEVELEQDQVTDSSSQCYATLKSCIQRHQILIEFCNTLDEIFTVITLVQVLTFSILICFVGYQVLLVDLTLSLRISFLSYLTVSMVQLWIFTYSCDCVTRESVNVALAVYMGPWAHLPMDKLGKMMRNDLQLVIIRSRRPCHLTACGFSNISIETYTKIMSTAMSYFTLLRQRTVDAIDT